MLQLYLLHDFITFFNQTKISSANESAPTPTHVHPRKKNFGCAPAHPDTTYTSMVVRQHCFTKQCYLHFQGKAIQRVPSKHYRFYLANCAKPQNTAFLIILRHA